MQHTRKTFTRLTALVTIILAGSVSRANATSFTVNDSLRGFFTSTADDSPFASDSNYVVGYCPSSPCGVNGPAEFRNFFKFSVPTLDGPVSSALLTIYTSTVSTTDSPSMTYQVTSLPAAFGFADLGTGTVFGSRTYTSADANKPESIVLDAAALAAIQSGSTFGVGGRITTLLGSPSSEFFGSSTGPLCGSRCTVTLQIETVPEPATLTLLAGGLATGAALRRRRRSSKAA